MRSFPSRKPATTSSEAPSDRGRSEAEKRAAAVGIVASDDGGEDEMKQADEEVGDAEQHGVVSEGARHRQGDAEHRRHRGEHRQPDATLVDVHRARQPRVDAPRPPERREHEHPAEDSTPRRVVREQDRDLGDREHEDQVEEELERRDLVLVALLVLGVGHGHRLRRPGSSCASVTGMRATVMYGAGDVRVETVPDARLIEPTDALVAVTRAAICGSDLWPYK